MHLPNDTNEQCVMSRSEMKRNNRSRQSNKPSLQKLEETICSMSDDFFEHAILKVEDDLNHVVHLGRFYRHNSFR